MFLPPYPPKYLQTIHLSSYSLIIRVIYLLGGLNNLFQGSDAGDYSLYSFRPESRETQVNHLCPYGHAVGLIEGQFPHFLAHPEYFYYRGPSLEPLVTAG